MSKKYLYYFSEGNDAFGGDKVTMKNTLGGKGAGLAEMTAAGMPVPQGFTITTDACTQYYADGRQINDDITADIFERFSILADGAGEIVDAHRSACKFVHDGEQKSLIHKVQSHGVDLEHTKRRIGYFCRDDAVVAHLCKITHTSQQSIGNARRTAGSASDFIGSCLFDGDI